MLTGRRSYRRLRQDPLRSAPLHVMVLVQDRGVIDLPLFSASTNALLRMIARVLSPSNGRNTLPEMFAAYAGTMHRYWSFGSIKMLPLPR